MDERLRELERVYASSGSEVDELKWLLACAQAVQLDWGQYSRYAELSPEGAGDYLDRRVVSGELHGDQIKLAAFLGHEPARLREPGAAEEGNRLFEANRWASALGLVGKPFVLRVVLALAELALPLLERWLPGEPQPQSVVDTVCAWREDPSDISRDAIEWALIACRLRINWDVSPHLHGATSVVQAVTACGNVVLAEEEARISDLLQLASASCRIALSLAAEEEGALDLAANRARIRACVRRATLPWVLDYER